MPLAKFKDLPIGAKFQFPQRPAGSGFSYTCTKVSAGKYEWTEKRGTYQTRVGSVNVDVVPEPESREA